jgi:hypothetical protein
MTRLSLIGCLNENQSVNSTPLALLAMQSLENQTTPQQKQETSVSIWPQLL